MATDRHPDPNSFWDAAILAGNLHIQGLGNVGQESLLREHNITSTDWHERATSEAAQQTDSGTQTCLSVDQAYNPRLVGPPPAYQPAKSRLSSLSSLFKRSSISTQENIELGNSCGEPRGRLQRRNPERRSTRDCCIWLCRDPEARSTKTLLILIVLGVGIGVCLAIAVIVEVKLQHQREMAARDDFVCGRHSSGPSCVILLADDAVVTQAGVPRWLARHCEWEDRKWLCQSTVGDGISKAPDEVQFGMDEETA